MASNMCKIDINLTKQVNDAIITMLLKKGGNEFLMKKGYINKHNFIIHYGNRRYGSKFKT